MKPKMFRNTSVPIVKRVLNPSSIPRLQPSANIPSSAGLQRLYPRKGALSHISERWKSEEKSDIECICLKCECFKAALSASVVGRSASSYKYRQRWKSEDRISC